MEDHVQRLMARSDIMASMAHADDHPEERERLTPEQEERIRTAPDVDWEVR